MDYKKTVKKHMTRIVNAMKSLGTYRPELDGAIRELAINCALYDINEEQWAKAGHAMTDLFENKNGKMNVVKNQFFMNHQQLDDKILRREKELGLTTYSMDKLGVLDDDEELDRLDQLLAGDDLS